MAKQIAVLSNAVSRFLWHKGYSITFYDPVSPWYRTTACKRDLDGITLAAAVELYGGKPVLSFTYRPFSPYVKQAKKGGATHD